MNGNPVLAKVLPTHYAQTYGPFMNSFSIRFSLLVAAFGLSAGGTCHAVHVDPHGRGQALILPYYTVNAGKATLLTLINTRDSAKAVRVRFRESRNGAEVMAFNLYLAPLDTWTGALTAPDAGQDYAQAGPASLSSSDNSCTVPRLPISGGQTFYDFAYAGINGTDPGPYELSRTREGFVEVIELGRIEDVKNFAAADAIKRSSRGDPSGCDLLNQAWGPATSPLPQAPWFSLPGLGVLSPDGGLQASAIIVDVALGSSFSVPAVALDGFFVPNVDCAPDCRGRPGENLHMSPGNASPTLADARSGAAATAVAEFHHEGKRQQMVFTGIDAGLKAVSAVLMKRHLDNTFQTSQTPPLVARSEWVLTFPTKALHLEATNPAQRLPFRSSYAWNSQATHWPIVQVTGACEQLRIDYVNREGERAEPVTVVEFPTRPGPRSPGLCHVSQVVTLNDPDARQIYGERMHDALRGDRSSRLLGSAHPIRLRACKQRPAPAESSTWRGGDCLSVTQDSDFTHGWMRIELGEPQRNFLFSSLQPEATQPSQPNLLLGLPVIGFAITEFESTGYPGVLANFSTLTPHSGVSAPTLGRVDPTQPAEGWSPVNAD